MFSLNFYEEIFQTKKQQTSRNQRRMGVWWTIIIEAIWGWNKILFCKDIYLSFFTNIYIYIYIIYIYIYYIYIYIYYIYIYIYKEYIYIYIEI